MLRNMVTSLVEHERIRTTTAKVSQAEGVEGGREEAGESVCVHVRGHPADWADKEKESGQGLNGQVCCVCSRDKCGSCLPFARSRFTRLPWD